METDEMFGQILNLMKTFEPKKGIQVIERDEKNGGYKIVEKDKLDNREPYINSLVVNDMMMSAVRKIMESEERIHQLENPLEVVHKFLKKNTKHEKQTHNKDSN